MIIYLFNQSEMKKYIELGTLDVKIGPFSRILDIETSSLCFRGGNTKNDLYNHFGSTLILAVLEWGINCGHFEPTYVSFDALGLTLEGLKVY